MTSYLEGETPNPCLACNRHIKFDKLMKFAESLGATHLASGHYARILEDTVNGQTRYRLFESNDLNKDQSYVLYATNQKDLATTLYPVGSKPKNEIRTIARQFDLPNAGKAESQEICFVPNRDYGSYIQNQIRDKGLDKPSTAQAGLIKNKAGHVLGEHTGVAFYTVGQRKGLGLTTPEPYYVVELDPQTNTIVAGPDSDGLSKNVIANDPTWIFGSPPDTQFKALVKIRYRHEPAPATVTAKDNSFEVVFDEPQRAVSPGQAAVLYRWDTHHQAREVIGGGTIRRSAEGRHPGESRHPGAGRDPGRQPAFKRLAGDLDPGLRRDDDT